MIVPTTAEQYGEYAVTRSNLALPSGDLLPLNYTDNNGVNYGLHPSMPELQIFLIQVEELQLQTLAP